MSSSLLEGYKLSLKYITVIANYKNSLSVNLSQTFTLHSYLCSQLTAITAVWNYLLSCSVKLNQLGDLYVS